MLAHGLVSTDNHRCIIAFDYLILLVPMMCVLLAGGRIWAVVPLVPAYTGNPGFVIHTSVHASACFCQLSTAPLAQCQFVQTIAARCFAAACGYGQARASAADLIGCQLL
jgi:hypothetical protein